VWYSTPRQHERVTPANACAHPITRTRCCRNQPVVFEFHFWVLPLPVQNSPWIGLINFKTSTEPFDLFSLRALKPLQLLRVSSSFRLSNADLGLPWCSERVMVFFDRLIAARSRRPPSLAPMNLADRKIFRLFRSSAKARKAKAIFWALQGK